MLTVTNAINSHYLPLHLRQDGRNNQHPANMTNAHALTMPVIPPPQRFFDAPFSRFFNPSSNPTTNTFSPVVAQRHRFEAQLPTPAVYVPTSLTQKPVEIDTALPYHYNSKISSQMDLINHSKNMSQASSPEQRRLMIGYTKPKECIFQDFVPYSSEASLLTSSFPTSSQNTTASLLQNRQHTGRALSETSISSAHLTSNTVFPSHLNLPSQLNFVSSSTNRIVNKGNTREDKSRDIKTKYSKSISNNENNYNDNLIRNSDSVEEDQGNTISAESETTKLVEINTSEIMSDTTVLDNQRNDNKSLCEDSVTVGDLKVRSLRHSIESILNMQTSFRGRSSELTRENKGRNDEYTESIIKEESPDEIEEKFDEDDNDNLHQSKSHEIKDEEKDVDGDCDDAISVSSTGSNENIADNEIQDGKEDLDVDVISCNERLNSTLSSSEEELNLHPRHSSILENNSLNNYNQGIQQTNEDILEVPMELGDDVTTNISFGHASEKDQITTEFDPESSQLKQTNFEKSSKYINEHLKRIEGLITKQNADHFQKDEFFQAKMQILRSVTKDCVITANGQEVVNQQINREEGFPINDVGLNNCNLMSSVSKLPPFHSLLPSDHVPNIRPCPPLCQCRQNPHFHTHNQYSQPFQTTAHQTILQCTEQIQDEGHRNLFEFFEEESQKSAFKPIIKKTVSSPLTSMQSLCQSKTDPRAEHIDPIGPPVHRSSVGYPETVFNPSNDDTMKIGNSPSVVSKEHSLDNSISLDAISLLRLRSNSYQCPGSLPSSFSYSSTSRPNPEAFRTWLTWLRARNPDALVTNSIQQNIPSILSKVPVPPRYHCGDCNKTYSTFGGLSKHRQFHCALHVKKEFACKICTKSYSSLGALKMHIRTHTLPCKCHICGKAFSRPWLLQGHVRTHTGEKPFRCNHCGRAFADRSNLRAHLQTHAEIKKYACVKCGKTFSRMSLLTKHSDGSCPANTSSCI